jgi:hypothetical protein
MISNMKPGKKDEKGKTMEVMMEDVLIQNVNLQVWRIWMDSKYNRILILSRAIRSVFQRTIDLLKSENASLREKLNSKWHPPSILPAVAIYAKLQDVINMI